MPKLLVLVGTYSEAILMAPLVRRFRLEPRLQTLVCIAAEPRGVLDEALGIFGVRADDHPARTGGESAPVPSETVDLAIRRHRPDWVLLLGDTAASIKPLRLRTAEDRAAVLCMCPLRYSGGGQPGLHSVDADSVRFLVSSEASRDALLGEGVVSDRIDLTDDLAVDALRSALDRIGSEPALQAGLAASFPFLDPAKRLILVLGHRRGDRGGGLEGVCRALRRLAARSDVQIAYPVSPNPTARNVVDDMLAGHPGIALIQPQDYLHTVFLMRAAALILADSGDTPTEALSAGKPVLVMRDVSDRPDAVDAGTIKLVGTDEERILRECTMFLDDSAYYRAFSAHCGSRGGRQASVRILELLAR